MIHEFDFDERAEGNLESIPKYWLPLYMPGFPRFTEGRFDFHAGHNTPPSFYLESGGRSVAYQYFGPETAVRPRTVYRVTGYVRPNQLRTARACLSAHFVDASGNSLPETLVRSPFIGSHHAEDNWVRIECQLPEAPPSARSIGLIAWVLQEPVWRTEPPAPGHIPFRDVRAGAWFDDITVSALPRVELWTSRLGQILTPDAPQHLYGLIADYEDTTLRGELRVLAADGGLVDQLPAPIAVDARQFSVELALDRYAPGQYTAKLSAYAGSDLLAQREITFLRLAPRPESRDRPSGRFAVALDAAHRPPPEVELELIRNLLVRGVEVPVWPEARSGLSARTNVSEEVQLAQTLSRQGYTLDGVLAHPPPELALGPNGEPLNLVEMLSQPPATWEQSFASIVAGYATVFHAWRIGAYALQPLWWKEGYADALERLRASAGVYTTTPKLIGVAAITDWSPDGPILPEAVNLVVPPQVDSASLPGYSAARNGLADGRQSLVLLSDEHLPLDRPHRLAEFARRVLTARHLGAGRVVVPQPWLVRTSDLGQETVPREEYVLLRTIAGVMGDAQPGGELRLGGSVRCLVFHRGNDSTLALWDRGAPFSGKSTSVQLGAARHQCDLWGNVKPMARDEKGRHRIEVSPMPVLVEGVERWLVEFLQSLTLEPSNVESGTEIVRHTLALVNRGVSPLSGTATWMLPAGWEANPRTFTFHLSGDRLEHVAVQLRYPHTERAGIHLPILQVAFVSPDYLVEAPLPITLGLDDLEVRGAVAIEDGALIVRHILFNRGSQPVQFRSQADVPGRARQYRPVVMLEPGKTRMVSYRFRDAHLLSGATVRLGLRELEGSRRSHALELTVP